MNGEINKSFKKINVIVEMKNFNNKFYFNLKEKNVYCKCLIFLFCFL